MGGEFRAYSSLSEYEDVDPVGDRLLVFWSDRLVHEVRESYAPSGKADHRYALTVWVMSEDQTAIYLGEEVQRHFPDLQTPNSLNHY